MQIKEITVGLIEVNCYVIVSDDKLYVIDPGSDADKIIPVLKNTGKPLEAILLTHGHIDHISAVKQISEVFNNAPVYIHNDERDLYLSPKNSIEPFYPPINDPVQPISKIEAKNMEIIHTPGHSPGGVCFYFPNENVIFTGDTLFCGSIGRTDLPGGNYNQLIDSIKTKIAVLPDNTKVYPGHGPSSTVGDEKRTNPFLQ